MTADMTVYLFVALPILGLVILFCFLAAGWTLIRGLFGGPPRLRCERCGVIRVTTDGNHSYTFPEDFPDDRGVICRSTGHAWTTNKPKELQ